MVKKCLILFGLILSLNNCEKSSEFELKKEPYVGDNLQIDGYYFKKYFNENTNHEAISVYFMYRDGVLLYGGDNNFEGFEELEDFYNQGYYNLVMDIQYYWGTFSIEENNLNMKHWESGQGGNLPVIDLKCTILDDITFVIEEGSVSNSSGNIIFRDTFHFKQFTPKPDSLNQFVQ